MEELPILNIIGGVLLYIAKFTVLIAAIIAVSKRRDSGSTLMLIGAISIVISDVVGMVLLINAGRAGAEQVVKITGINSILTALTYLLFAIGLLFFMIQTARRTTELS